MNGWSRSTERTIGQVLDLRLEDSPDKPLFVVEGRAVSYRELDSRSNAFANCFLDLGVAHGDTVATVMLNCEEIVYSWFACAKLGAIHVPMHAARGDQVVDQLRTAGCTVAIADRDLAADLAPRADQLPALRHLFVRGAASDEVEPSAAGSLQIVSFDALFGNDAEVKPPHPPEWDDLSSILFTGGTTGASKGVAMSHNYVLTAARGAARQVDFRLDSVAFQPSPLYHVAATMGAVMVPLLQGGTGATELRFDPSTYWERVRHYGATQVSLRMPMVVMLLAQPPRDDDGDNTVRFSTAPQLPRDTRLAFEERFGMRFVHSYACSECIPILVGTPEECPPPGRSGRPNPDLDVRLVDDKDREVAPGQVGEFVVRPRQPAIMFSGYYNDGAATAKAFRNLWFHTGDLGRVHEDGWWSVVDRKGDELRVGDEVHSTFEIEGTVLEHPGVEEAAVYSVQGPDGTAVKLDLRVRSTDFDHAGFVEFCSRKLPVTPRYVEVVDDFPRGAASRVQKFKLRAQGVTPRTWDAVTGSFCA